MRKFLSVVFTGSLVLGSAAQAAPPVASAAWNQNPVPVKIHTALAPACDDPTAFAMDTWSYDGGSQFKYSGPTFTETRVMNLNNYGTREGRVVNIQDDDSIPSGTHMRTRVAYSADVANQINDADVFVRYDFSYYTNSPTYAGYFCSSGTPRGDQIDYESAMVHELGHAMGFVENYSTTTACVMYPTLRGGAVRRTLCADDRQGAINTYGRGL